MNDLSSLKRLEIELHSHCNRKCEWCPNKYTKRLNGIMSSKLFKSIIDELKEYHFDYRYNQKDSKKISLNGYGEPLLYPSILQDRVNYIRKLMPTVEIVINTNGDYLTNNILSSIKLTRIHIMDYDSKGKEYWENKFKELDIHITQSEDKSIIGYHTKGVIVKVLLNWKENHVIDSRGGYLLDKIDNIKVQKKRIKKCIEPIERPVINYNGCIMMCCNTRSDTHPDLIIGNLNESSLIDLFNGEKWTKLREDFKNLSPEEYLEVCQTCTKRYNPDINIYINKEKGRRPPDETKSLNIHHNKYLNNMRKLKSSINKKG